MSKRLMALTLALTLLCVLCGCQPMPSSVSDPPQSQSESKSEIPASAKYRLAAPASGENDICVVTIKRMFDSPRVSKMRLLARDEVEPKYTYSDESAWEEGDYDFDYDTTGQGLAFDLEIAVKESSLPQIKAACIKQRDEKGRFLF